MRIGIVSALFVPLLLVYSPGPAAAQFNPVSPELSQVLLPKLPSPPKFPVLPRAADSGSFGLSGDLTIEPMYALGPLRNSVVRQEGASAMGTQSLAEASRCDHILIFQAPTLDSKMIKEVPREFASNMPRLEGLQPCSRDFHSGMVLPRMAPLVGPGRIGALAPLSYGMRP